MAYCLGFLFLIVVSHNGIGHLFWVGSIILKGAQLIFRKVHYYATLLCWAGLLNKILYASSY
jgi:hypothetical protein